MYGQPYHDRNPVGQATKAESFLQHRLPVILTKGKLLLVGLLFLMIAGTADAQLSRKQVYDSSLVGDRITPAVSSVMMPKSYTEVILNSSMVSTNTYFDADREKLDMTFRSTTSITTLQMTHGISSSGRFNLGLDVSYRVRRMDGDPESSPFKVFSGESDGLIEYQRAFTSVGVRVRYVPTRNRNFVIQQIFTIPVSSGSEEGAFLGDNRYALNNQFLYTQLLGRKFFLFGQLDVLVRFEDDQNSADFTLPLNVFATYLLNNHLFPFVQVGMVNLWGDDYDPAQSFTYGLGLQYQFSTMFNINAFYSDAFNGRNIYKFSSLNLGVRVVF
jgi:hypothetical protein